MPKVTISFDPVRGADESYIAAFIYDALSTMGGCRQPEDPLFHSLNLRSISFHRGETFEVQPRRLVKQEKVEQGNAAKS